MNKEEILRVVPHRPPMLFIDDILSVEYKKSVRGVKNVSESEPWAQGHFPGDPVFPGALMLETMAQIGCFLYYHGPETAPILAHLAKADDLKWTKKVVPGNTVVVEGVLLEEFDKLSKVKVTAKVGTEIVAKGTLTYFFVER